MRTPFFITGSGRSGSTYLFHLLNAHPQIGITNEARILDALLLADQIVALPYGETHAGTGVRGVVSADTHPLLGNVFRAHLLPIMEEYYAGRFGPSIRYFGDKLPDYVAVGMAAQWAPSIRIILLVRDPRDVVVSYRIMAQRVVGNGPREEQLRTLTVSSLARIWRETYEFLLPRIRDPHVVRYDALVTDPTLTARGIIEWFGLEWDGAIDREIATNTSIRTHGSSATAASSIARWRRDLTSADADAVTEICGPMMSRLDLSL